MKRINLPGILIAILIVSIVILSCKKNNNSTVYYTNKALVGKWKYIIGYEFDNPPTGTSSIGGILLDTPSNMVYNSDDSFLYTSHSSPSLYQIYPGRYAVLSGSQMQYILQDSTLNYFGYWNKIKNMQTLNYSIYNDTLTISYITDTVNGISPNYYLSRKLIYLRE